MLQLSFDVNTNIFSTLLFSSGEISCIFHRASYLRLLSYIKRFEDKQPDFENIILLEIYPLVWPPPQLRETEKPSINYFNALCKNTYTVHMVPSFLLANLDIRVELERLAFWGWNNFRSGKSLPLEGMTFVCHKICLLDCVALICFQLPLPSLAFQDTQYNATIIIGYVAL